MRMSYYHTLILVLCLQCMSGVFAIQFPGTKWCGIGNIATNYNDLGTEVATDTCCRAHDHCVYNIRAFAYKYNYRNWRWYTISTCECDQK